MLLKVHKPITCMSQNLTDNWLFLFRKISVLLMAVSRLFDRL